MARICKNEVTDIIRDQFGANTLKVPEARIQPMCMLEIRNGSQQYLGQFEYLVKGGFEHTIPAKTETVSSVSNQRTKVVDFNFGFGILGNFLKALGADPASVTAAIRSSQKMAFSFTNVRRTYIDPLMLGSILSQHEILADKDNFILHPALSDKQVRLGLITDIIVSNNFSLSAFTESGKNATIDVPAIANALGNVNATLKVEKTAENEVKFEGDQDLTFAFSCLEIKIDAVTGKFSRGNWLENIRSVNGESRTFESMKPEDVSSFEKLMIDENEEFPLLIEL
ncbi:MAG: hypothetical protein M3R25_06105 [Bacteroidota bacterium]|nr:hypothetical protein [Bacteroidota bacterium]